MLVPKKELLRTMPGNLFWLKDNRLKTLLPALLIVLVVGVILYRNSIVRSIINYSGSAYAVTAECLDFDLQWNLSANISKLCLKHPSANIVLRDANWNIWSNTLSINTLSVHHLYNPSDSKQSLNAEEQRSLITPFALPDLLPVLEIKGLVISSPLLDAPLNLKVNQTTATSFQLLGEISGEIAIEDGKILAELSWMVADLSKYFTAAKQRIADYSEVLDIVALNQIRVISKIEFDGGDIKNLNHLNVNNTLSVNNCLLPFSAIGDVSIKANIAQISAEIDLSKLQLVAELQKCQTLVKIPELSNFQRLVIDIPQPLNFQDNEVMLSEINAIIPGATPSMLKLFNLNLKLTPDSRSTLNYELSISPEIEPNLDFKKISYLSAGQIVFSGKYLQLQTQQNKIEIIDSEEKKFETAQLEAALELHFSGPEGISGNGKLHSSQISLIDTKIGNLSTTFELSTPNISDMQIHFESKLNNISYSALPALSDKTLEKANAPTKLAIKQLSSSIDLKLNAFNRLSVNAETKLNRINLANLAFSQIIINHQLQGNIIEKSLSSSHSVVLDKTFSAKVEQQQRQFQLHISEQPLSHLQSVITPLLAELEIADGQISASIAGELDNSDLSGQFRLENIVATFKDYRINGMNYQDSFVVDSAGLQLGQSNITINSVDVGLPVHHIQASLSASDSQLKLKNISGEIFGGRFYFNDIWLDDRSQSTKIELNDIELAKLIELQQQSGIQISGQVRGSLPIQFSKDGVTIDGGTLISQGPGHLKIINNPAFDSIKAQQSELAFLENMDFTQLSSTVKFNSDGWLFLNFSLVGDNPEKKQSLKFNYSHQENIFTLLKSLRLANSVQNKIEKSLKEGGKK
ncbi:MAG: hypothetical protein ACI88A_004606 [Paraglaciecola sp.]|jgi:hypothetical protein